MDSYSTSYQIRPLTSFLIHGDSVPKIVADNGRIRICPHDVDVMVHSGDYFITLATILDQLGKQSADPAIRGPLEDIVSDLIYLHDNYTIIAKEKQAK